MDSDKSHRTGSTSSTSSELFICFTSRLSSSSSSMKISSKSILSPGRARDPPISLSTSLSRRLRTNGSMKGGQASPMFPTGGKKRGCGFENPEPSSPKVTCIGQVRVKTKKQGKKMRTLSRRQTGEVSFRKLEQSASQSQNQCHASAYQQTNASNNQECVQHRNQRWVHLPLTICEALRAFGAEFSCLFPCRPSCFSSTSEREKQEKAAAAVESEGSNGQQSSCGAVFARWLVALQDGEGEKRREIELVVGGDEERNDLTEIPVRNSRRHVFDEMEIKDEMCHVKDEVEEEDEARVSICIPPKNALLLMRCRSDPMKMAALTNRFWESPAPKDEEADDDEDKAEDDEEIEYAQPPEALDECDVKYEVEMVEKDEQVPEKRVSIDVHEEQENSETETNLEMELQQEDDEEINEQVLEKSEQEKTGETEVNQTVEEENAWAEASFEALVDQEEEEEDPIEEENRGSSYSSYSDKEEGEPEEEALGYEAALDLGMEKVTEATALEDKEEEIVTHERSDPVDETHEEEEEGEGRKSEERERSVLPECLLLMMCEPKLSMEVSKETWVCSTDFIRWQPVKQQVKPTDGQDDSNKTRVTTDSDSNPNPIPPRPPVHDQPLQQPARSSCSFPAPAGGVTGVSMATMIEQKLVNAGGYEPFVLTRCKSEPMRTAAAKLAPDTCFWKNRKLEPHRRSNFGVGAAGVGF